MAVEFFIPKMTEHMETARIVRWLVKEGDRVSKGQVVLEVETEKAISEVEAPAKGYIKGIREGLIEGFEVKVGETIAFIVKEGEHIPSLSPLKKEKVATKADSVSIQSETDQTISTTNQIRATPSARRLSKEAGIDLNLISGSGEAGRIREEDVQQFLIADFSRVIIDLHRLGMAIEVVICWVLGCPSCISYAGANYAI